LYAGAISGMIEKPLIVTQNERPNRMLPVVNQGKSFA
jgi:hypothetical protein